MNKHLEALAEIDDLGGPDVRGFQGRGFFKGGGKKGGDPAAFQREQEAKKEAQRQAFYKGTGWQNPDNVKARDVKYADMQRDITGFQRGRLDQEFAQAQKQARFNNARSGLSGSSQAASDEAEMTRKYNEGLADIDARAQGAVSSARSGGEAAFNRGLQQINAGADATTQISSALADIANAMQSAIEGAKGGSWGGFFGNLASTVDTAKVKAGQAGAVQAQGATPQTALANNVSASGAGSGTYIR